MMTKDELWVLRQEIKLGSLFYADYRNSFGIDTHPVCDFFDGYLEYLDQEMQATVPGYDDAHFSIISPHTTTPITSGIGTTCLKPIRCQSRRKKMKNWKRRQAEYAFENHSD